MRAEVLDGLSRPQKWIPPKFFYDRRGSQLFDAITELPEYYPTRTEIRILAQHGAAIADYLGKKALLLELGSGSSLKIRTLLEALEPAVYVPVDISREHLLASARDLADSFPGLTVRAICADYSLPFDLPFEDARLGRAAFFPGSSIGNFDPGDAVRFLQRVASLVGAGGRVLVGVDLIKDRARLEAAYNDRKGVTADFNLNLLQRVNRELEADFDLDEFDHRASFNEGSGRVEMHLISRTSQEVKVAGERFTFREGESIHTENSYKYSIEGFRDLACTAGLEPEQVWTDPEDLFSVHGLRVA
jgi:dimethylhistidine N-methyltransferase